MSPELILAIAALITAAAGAWKVTAEARKIRAELVPNHGSSARDSMDRTEAVVTKLAETVDRGQARHDKELSRLNDAQLATTSAMLAGFDRLAQADAEDRRHADHEHARIWNVLTPISPQEES